MAANIPSINIFDEERAADNTSLATTWRKWLTRLTNYIDALGITADKRKRALLLHMLGPNTYDDFTALPDTGTDFQHALQALNAHFAPQQNVEYERAKFRKLQQNTGELIDAYHVRLRQQAQHCEFTNIDLEIKSHLIQTTKDSKLRKKGLRQNMSLDELLQEGRSNELCKQQNEEIEKSLSMSGADSQEAPETINKVYTNLNRQRNMECRNCGGTYPHDGGFKNCPAYGIQCHNCRKFNHLAKFCRSRRNSPQQNRRQNGQGNRQHNRNMETESYQRPSQNSSHSHQNSRQDDRRRKQYVRETKTQNYETDESDSDNNYLFAISPSDKLRQPPKFRVYIDEVPLTIIADTAATCDVIDGDTYNRYFKQHELTVTKTDINPYGEDSQVIKPIGKFRCTIKSDNHSADSTIYVVPGKCGNLLGIQTCQILDLVRISNQHLQVHKLQTSIADKLTEEYPKLFEGIGLMKEYAVKLHIDEQVPPVAQRHRRIPFHLRQKLETEIQRLEDLDIIEKVTGPTPWISPVVVAPKPKNPEEIRLCVDMRQANKAIIRERHPAPTIDDIYSRLTGSTHFSKLDLRSGYHQLMLSEESRYITTFSTHLGLRRYKRLNFGISSASEVFQNAVEHVIDGIDGAMNFSDDIIIFGKTETEHDKTLKQVCMRLQEYGLTLNSSKCEFNKTKIEFYGTIFSKDGITPDPKKINSIINITQPQSVEEVRSLLGMTNFCSRFIRNYSTLANPLRLLTTKNAKFHWGKEQQAALDALKQCLSHYPVLQYYDHNKSTEILVDASPVGLGAILTQVTSDGTRNVVAFGSRALTPVEQRYAQVEREALAIVWACEHFHLYIYGGPVTVMTDHKPLVSIFNNPNKNLTMRLERWSLRLQPYQPTILYRTGYNNPADFLSRHSLCSTETNSRQQRIAEEYINFIASHAVPKAMSLKEITDHTDTDDTLQTVKNMICTEDWHKFDHDKDSSIKAYQKVQDELAVTESGLIMREKKICMPAKLQQRTIDIAHEGHQGISKTKALLREKVWFPNIDQMVTNTVSSCLACQACDGPGKTTRQPLQMTELPEAPWSNLCIDFYGPLPSGHYLLVVIDEYSRFPEVEITKSTAAKAVIPVLDKIFASKGIPLVLKSDNGPPFQSEEFAEFSRELGFQHRKITPYWPEANACAERFMRNIGKVCKCAQLAGKPWQRELQIYLRSYRATPHSSTGHPPATLLYGRALRTKLPELTTQTDDAAIRERDQKAKSKMKANAEKTRHTVETHFKEGDKVLVKNTQQASKFSPRYDPNPFTVVKEKGPMVLIQRGKEKKARNKQHLKPYRHYDDRINDSHTERNTEADVIVPEEEPKAGRPKRRTAWPKHLSDYVT